MDDKLQSALMQVMLNNKLDDFEDKLSGTKQKCSDLIKDSVAVKASLKDHYGNSLTATGTDDKVADFSTYGFSNDSLNYPLWLALYNDSWVFRRAIDKPAQDEIRAGITIRTEFEGKSEVLRLMRQARFDLIQLLQWGALFGGSVAVMMFDGLEDADYAKSIDVNKVRRSKTIRYYVTDRWYGCAPSSETVTDMSDVDFGKPVYYDITFADGKSLRVHHDYVLRYEHRVAPKLIKNGQLQGWGYAEGAHIINELARDDKLKTSIQSLINKSLIEVIKMSGMRGVFMGADDASEQQLRKRLEMVNWGRSFNSLTFLDKEDEYSEHSYAGLGGLSDLLEKNMWQIAAALEMQGILFGDLKGGFSNDTEALERYDETINMRNESYVRPVLEKLLKTLYIMKGIEQKVDFEFNSLLVKLQNEQSITNLQNVVNVCTTLLQDGVITTRQYAETLMNYSSKNVLQFKFTDKQLSELDDRVKEEMEKVIV